MSTPLLIALCVAVAGAVVWLVHRRETALEPSPTACSRVVDQVFANGAVNAPDSLLLERLLVHQDDCMHDAVFVDQTRRLLLITGQPEEARNLLTEAERSRALTADELKAQVAWTDLAAAHLARTRDMDARADELRARAISSANALRAKWPEWSIPYRILDEAARTNWKSPASAAGVDYYQIERSARGRIVNGAFARGLTGLQPIVFAFVGTLMAMLALAAGVSGLLAMRAMTTMPTSAIGSASPGYGKFKGVLHLPPQVDAVIGPHSKSRGVWYVLERNSGSKGAQTTYERSAQPFLLRDTSAEALIVPQQMHVRTRHVSTQIVSGGGVTSSRRVSERMLKEGDTAYVLGELQFADASSDGARRISMATNGRRLLVSNLTEEQLLFRERLWLWIGLSVFALASVALAWAYYQRYHVMSTPGVLQ